MTPILSVRDLTISFGSRGHPELNFEVDPGDNLAIIGPNGAGKSVLLRALLNLLPYEGVIEWAPDAKLGYVPQKIAADRQLPLQCKRPSGGKGTATETPRSGCSVGRRQGGPYSRTARNQHRHTFRRTIPKGSDRIRFAGRSKRTAVRRTDGQSRRTCGRAHLRITARLTARAPFNRFFWSRMISVSCTSSRPKFFASAKGKPCFGPPREILTTGNSRSRLFRATEVLSASSRSLEDQWMAIRRNLRGGAGPAFRCCRWPGRQLCAHETDAFGQRCDLARGASWTGPGLSFRF